MNNQGELNLKEFIKVLISSKKIFLTITFLSTFIVAAYSLSLKDSYTSSVSISIGEYNETPVISNANLDIELQYLFNVSTIRGGKNLLKASYTSSSQNESIDVIKDLSNYVNLEYQIISHTENEKDQIKLKLLNNKIEFIESEIDLINNKIVSNDLMLNLEQRFDEVALTQIESYIESINKSGEIRNDSFDSESDKKDTLNALNLANALILSSQNKNQNVSNISLKLELESLEAEKSLVKIRQSSLKETKVGEIITSKNIRNRKSLIFLGFISGLFLSIFTIYFLSIYYSQQREN